MAFEDILNRIMFKLQTFSILQLENRFSSKDGMKLLKPIANATIAKIKCLYGRRIIAETIHGQSSPFKVWTSDPEQQNT